MKSHGFPGFSAMHRYHKLLALEDWLEKYAEFDVGVLERHGFEPDRRVRPVEVLVAAGIVMVLAFVVLWQVLGYRYRDDDVVSKQIIWTIFFSPLVAGLSPLVGWWLAKARRRLAARRHQAAVARETAAFEAEHPRPRTERSDGPIETWQIGAEAEKRTAKVLEALGDEWSCWHDLQVDRANIDHLLVGPPGFVVVDTKFWAGVIDVQDGRLVNAQEGREGQKLDKVPRTVSYEVRRLLQAGVDLTETESTQPFDSLMSVPVYCFIAVQGALVQFHHQRVDAEYDMEVVSLDHLVQRIQALPRTLDRYESRARAFGEQHLGHFRQTL